MTCLKTPDCLPISYNCNDLIQNERQSQFLCCAVSHVTDTVLDWSRLIFIQDSVKDTVFGLVKSAEL